MPQITINGQVCDFDAGKTILQVAYDNGIEIPHYCYHPGLSVVASCRICLAEVHAPNPRNENKMEPIPKLLPTCQTPAGDGQEVYTTSPKAVGNQKAVMEYLLLNHPVDCPVCDQAGECHLQDYSYQYGRSQVRFEEEKIKQPKKDIGPNVMLYSDRCIMCTRCVRFTREVTETCELLVDGRGAMEQIDVFPGLALDNELSGNVIDLCPVGALLDKDFMFQQRVWFLKSTPSIDGITASGDNILIEHANGEVFRIKPNTNMEVNRFWITDEVRYGWKHIHADTRLRLPTIKGEAPFEDVEAPLAWDSAYAAADTMLTGANTVALLVSPMLSCEESLCLAEWVSGYPGEVIFGVGPVPIDGEDKSFADGFTLRAEKAPNARGVRRVLEALGTVLDAETFAQRVASGVDAAVLTGNYPSDWVTDDLLKSLDSTPCIVIDTLSSRLSENADVVLPGATWMEKAGTFENISGLLQVFDRAVDPVDYVKSEGQIALDLIAFRDGEAPVVFNPAQVRQRLAGQHGLDMFTKAVRMPAPVVEVTSDMELVQL